MVQLKLPAVYRKSNFKLLTSNVCFRIYLSSKSLLMWALTITWNETNIVISVLIEYGSVSLLETAPYRKEYRRNRYTYFSMAVAVSFTRYINRIPY